MRSILKYLVMLIFVCLFANCSSSSTSYYFCLDSKYSLFKMFSIQVDAHERRLIRDPYYDSFPFAGTFVGSYDEENHIITTYKKEFKTGTTYLLWRFNFSSNKLYHDIVSEDSPEQFQLNTGFLPTPENIKKYNVKPELFKYVPDKKTDLSIIYMTFTKWSFNCQSMSYLRYKVQRAIFILYDMLASMG